MCLLRGEADLVPPPAADAHTLLPLMTTIAEALLAGIVHAVKVAMAIETEAHDVNTTTNVPDIGLLLVGRWKTTPLLEVATMTPIAETILPLLTLMPMDDPRTIGRPEISHLGRVDIRGKADILVTTSVADVTGN